MNVGVPAGAQWLKDLALPQLWSRLKLQVGFSPWPGNFHMPLMRQKRKKKKKKVVAKMVGKGRFHSLAWDFQKLIFGEKKKKKKKKNFCLLVPVTKYSWLLGFIFPPKNSPSPCNCYFHFSHEETDSERSSNFVDVTQLVSPNADNRNPGCLIQENHALCLCSCLHHAVWLVSGRITETQSSLEPGLGTSAQSHCSLSVNRWVARCTGLWTWCGMLV